MHSDRLSLPTDFRHILLGAAALLAVLLAYYPAVSSYLAFDDSANLQPLLQSSGSIGSLWEAVRNNQSGPTGRPVSMISFAAQIALLGSAVWHLKVINVLVHLLTGLALFALTRTMLLRGEPEADRSVASGTFLVTAAVALIWLLHPFNLTAVGYVIQRMTSLSALFTVLALLVYVRTRQGSFSLSAYARGAAYVVTFGLLGLFSKENAALLPVFALVAELTVLRDVPGPSLDDLSTRSRRIAGGVVVLAVALLTVLFLQQRTGGFEYRPFTLMERLLTEARVVTWYAGQVLWPNLASMSVFQDGWKLSTGLFTPVTTVLSLLSLGGVLLLGIVLRRRQPVIAFGLLFFLAGHLLESTVLPLELVFEHRNYLPSFGIILAACAGGFELARRMPRGVIAYAVLVLGCATALAGLTHVRAERWADDPSARLEHFAQQSRSMRAQIEAAQTYASLAARAEGERRQSYMRRARERFKAAEALNPAAPEPKFGLLMFGLTADAAVDTERLVDEIVHALQRDTVSATSLNGVHTLLRCIAAGPCRELAGDMDRILEAALANQSMKRHFRVLLLRDKATFFAKVEERPALARQTLEKALKISPDDANLHIEMAYYEALAGDRAEALSHLREAESLSQFGSKTDTIRRMRRAIVEGSVNPARAAPPAPDYPDTPTDQGNRSDQRQ